MEVPLEPQEVEEIITLTTEEEVVLTGKETIIGIEITTIMTTTSAEANTRMNRIMNQLLKSKKIWSQVALK